MAKCDVVPGLKAEIIINGVAVPEIQDPDEVQVEHADPDVAAYQAARTVSKYVEVCTGDHFTIRVGVGEPMVKPNATDLMKTPHSKICFYANVDSKEVWTFTCPRTYFKSGATSWEESVKGLNERNGKKWSSKNFKFAKLQTTDGSATKAQVKRLADKMKGIGIIEIKVYSGPYKQRSSKVETSSKGFVKETDRIPEKALKGIAKSHGVALGDAKKISKQSKWDVEKKDGVDFPLAIFRFMYRDHKALQSLHIIPRTPSPSPRLNRSRSNSVEVLEPLDTLFEHLTPAERRTADSYIRSLRNNTKKIKTEVIDVDDEGTGKQRGHARKRQRGSEGHAIIVDDSDDDELS